MLKKMLFLVFVGTAVVSQTQTSSAADFNLERYFIGKTSATGSFSAINGFKRNFTVALTGKWNGHTLTLLEEFLYDDGLRERKTWRFKKINTNTYRGTREDVVGQTLVTIKGNTAHFTYLMDVSEDNRVRFHDTMTLRPDGTLLNNALITKYGFPVALTKVEFKRD